MLCVILTDNLGDTIVLNVHAVTEGKTDVTKGRFYEELERVFSQFSKHCMKTLLHNFTAKFCREDIFRSPIWNKMRVYTKLIMITE
jgi:hypothetical protein